MKIHFCFSTTFIFLLSIFSAHAQWSTTNLSEAKVQLGAATIGTKVFFAGGYNEFAPQKKVEIYDLSTGLWSTGELSVARSFPAGTSAGSQVIFAGGVNLDNLTCYAKVDIWDTLTQQWTQTQLSQPRFSISAVSDGSKALFAGGAHLLNNTTYDVVDIYNAATHSWSVAHLSEGRAAMGAAVVETGAGKIAVFAGGFKMPSLTVSDRVDIYHFNTGSWTTATLSEPRGFVAAAAVDGKVVIAGGTTNANTPSNRVDIYDAESGVWSVATLSTARAFHIPGGNACGKALFAGGGMLDKNTQIWESASNRVDIYDAATNSWSVDSLSRSIVNHVVISANDHVLIAGGLNVNGGIDYSTVDIYQCVVNTIESRTAQAAPYRLWPNPSSGVFYWEYTGSDGASEVSSVRVTNLQGQLVYSQSCLDGNNISLPGIMPGTYLVTLVTGNQTWSKLILIMK